MPFYLLDEPSPVFFSGQFFLFIVIPAVVLVTLVIIFIWRKRKNKKS